jgi:hypothetical protein
MKFKCQTERFPRVHGPLTLTHKDHYAHLLGAILISVPLISHAVNKQTKPHLWLSTTNLCGEGVGKETTFCLPNLDSLFNGKCN